MHCHYLLYDSTAYGVTHHIGDGSKAVQEPRGRVGYTLVPNFALIVVSFALELEVVHVHFIPF